MPWQSVLATVREGRAGQPGPARARQSRLWWGTVPGSPERSRQGRVGQGGAGQGGLWWGGEGHARRSTPGHGQASDSAGYAWAGQGTSSRAPSIGQLITGQGPLASVRDPIRTRSTPRTPAMHSSFPRSCLAPGPSDTHSDRCHSAGNPSCCDPHVTMIFNLRMQRVPCTHLARPLQSKSPAPFHGSLIRRHASIARRQPQVQAPIRTF